MDPVPVSACKDFSECARTLLLRRLRIMHEEEPITLIEYGVTKID